MYIIIFFFFFFFLLEPAQPCLHDISITIGRINFILDRMIVDHGGMMPIDFDVDDVMRDPTLAPDWLIHVCTITRERVTAETSNLVYRFLLP